MPPYPSRSTCPPQRTQISDGNRESGRKLSSDYDDDVRVRSSVHHSSANLYAILLSLDSISATSGKKPDKLRMRLSG